MNTQDLDPDQRLDSFEIPDEIIVVLKKPFRRVASEEMLTHLSFRPPNVDELGKAFDKEKTTGKLGSTKYMLQLLSNDKLTPPDIGRINAIDFQLIQEQLGPFFDASAAFAGDVDRRRGLKRAVYGLAYFWKVSPNDVWGTSVTRFLEWSDEAHRIRDQLDDASREAAAEMIGR